MGFKLLRNRQDHKFNIQGGPFFKANRLRREKDTSCDSVLFEILQSFLKKLRF